MTVFQEYDNCVLSQNQQSDGYSRFYITSDPKFMQEVTFYMEYKNYIIAPAFSKVMLKMFYKQYILKCVLVN